MKKALVIIIAAVMTAVLCISASAAINSNHLIDEGYPRFNKDETEWDVFGWTVVDTKITAMGYILDGGSVKWVDDSVDTRDDAKRVEANDCFEDMELERAIIDYNLTNGLEEFYGYRIHITLDTSNMSKGDHQLEVVVKYEDGTTGNPMRDSVIEITKTKDASGGGEAQPADDKPEEQKTDDPKPVNPATSDAAVIAATAAMAIALAGVITARRIKVK